jgi:hypothetical protein
MSNGSKECLNEILYHQKKEVSKPLKENCLNSENLPRSCSVVGEDMKQLRRLRLHFSFLLLIVGFW